jgi:hypothetical protein
MAQSAESRVSRLEFSNDETPGAIGFAHRSEQTQSTAKEPFL